VTALRPGARPARAGLRVAVLGPLVITGAAAELQPRQAELVAALALASPAGVSAESLRGTLGTDADHPRASDSLRQLITRTRRRLGMTPGDGEYITHGGSGRYALDPAAAVDWDEFRALARQGRASRDPGPLRGAIGLLRGQPLAGCYFWWLDPVLIEAMRAEIVDASALLAGLELEDGDPPAARRAARAGLAADSAAEQLWRLLMLAEDASGNTAGVHSAWHGCLAAIADIAPGGEPHPDTVGLYQELAGGRRRPQAPARRFPAPRVGNGSLLQARQARVPAAGYGQAAS
jgi:DNA-binding SARP family transcriptional activator